MKDNIITFLVLLICLLCCFIIYFATELNYYKEKLEIQKDRYEQQLRIEKTKYNIIIQEQKIRDLMESGG